MRNTSIAICTIAAFGLAACTPAQKARYDARGTPARITCHSGGRVILDDVSDGKVQSSKEEPGYYYSSKTTGKLIEVSGDCVIDHRIETPAGWKPVLP